VTNAEVLRRDRLKENADLPGAGLDDAFYDGPFDFQYWALENDAQPDNEFQVGEENVEIALKMRINLSRFKCTTRFIERTRNT